MTTRLRSRHLLLTTSMTLLLGACGASSTPAATSAPNGAVASAPTAVAATSQQASTPVVAGPTSQGTGGKADPCSLLTQAEVDTAVGQPLGPGKQVSSTTDCLWSTSDFAAGVTLGLRTLPDIKFVTTANGQTPATSVPGVGDQAWVRTDSEGTSTLWVIKGSAGFMLTVNGSHVRSLPDHGLPAEEVLAAAILGRL